jgi:hypothetical protein
MAGAERCIRRSGTAATTTAAPDCSVSTKAIAGPHSPLHDFLTAAAGQGSSILSRLVFNL